MNKRGYFAGAAVSVIIGAAAFAFSSKETNTVSVPVCEDNVCSVGETWQSCPWDCKDNTIIQQKPFLRVYYGVSETPTGVYIPTGAGPTYTFNNSVFNATITNEGNDTWRLDITANNTIAKIEFPLITTGYGAGANFIPIDSNPASNQVWYPYLGGIVEMKYRRGVSPFLGEYPGDFFAPFILQSGEEYSQIVFAANNPAINVYPSHDNSNTRLIYEFSPSINIGQTKTLKAVVRKVRTNNSAYESWLIGALQYKRWLDTNYPAANKPTAIKNIDGFQYHALMNSTGFSTASLDSRFNAYKDKWGWIQFWGQMSTYAGDPNLASPAPIKEDINISVTDHVFTNPSIKGLYVRKSGGTKVLKYRVTGDVTDRTANITNNTWIFSPYNTYFTQVTKVGTTIDSATGITEEVGCCAPNPPTFIPPLQSRYVPTLTTWANSQTSNGYYVGYYSREPSSLIAPTYYNEITGRDYTSNWLLQNTNDGANAYYVDVVGRGVFGDAEIVRNYMNTWSPVTIIEGIVDIYPTMFLMDGFLCENPSYPGGPNYQYDLPTCKDENDQDKHCLAPMLGRFILGKRYAFSGLLNTESNCYGLANNYWVERQTFLLANKQVVASAIPGNVNAQNLLNYNARKNARFWQRSPDYVHTAGLTDIPNGITARKAVGSNGEQIIMIDNPSQLTGQTLRVKGKLISISSDKVSVIIIK
jgi:hypothetical protein